MECTHEWVRRPVIMRGSSPRGKRGREMRQLRVLVLFRFPPSVGAKEVIAAGARVLLPEQRRGKAFLSFRAAFGGGLVEGAKPATVDENLNESVRSCGRERSLARFTPVAASWRQIPTHCTSPTVRWLGTFWLTGLVQGYPRALRCILIVTRYCRVLCRPQLMFSLQIPVNTCK